jgi:hypothetical protein
LGVFLFDQPPPHIPPALKMSRRMGYLIDESAKLYKTDIRKHGSSGFAVGRGA